MLRNRERVMALTGDAMASRFNKAAHNLIPLTPGHQVRLQIQKTGRWDRVGVVTDTPAPILSGTDTCSEPFSGTDDTSGLRGKPQRRWQ